MRHKLTWAIALSAAAMIVAAGQYFTDRVAHAQVPAGPPTFSNPTVFTNEFMPFEVGAVKAYLGRSDGERTVLVDLYLDETRDFQWSGMTVTCSILQETEFEYGELVEVSTNFFTCADDGSVYYFGELVDDYEDGEVVSHDGAWLVGGPQGD